MTGQSKPDPAQTDQMSSSDLHDLPDVVASIVSTMRSGRIDRLVVTKGDFHLELERVSRTTEGANAAVSIRQADEENVEAEAEERRYHTITSPMIGTYYSSPQLPVNLHS